MDSEIKQKDIFSSYCRTCLKQDQGKKYIVNDLARPILTLLKGCARYNPDKLYPNGICEECYIKLKSFKEFQTLCKKAKNYFDNLTHDECLDPENENPLRGESEEIVVEVELAEKVDLQEDTKEGDEPVKNDIPYLISSSKPKSRTQTLKKRHCDVCEKFFSSHKVLRRHMLNHAEERPYSCDTCGHGFNTKYELMRHTEKHSVTQINCKYNCGQTFDRTFKAQKHYREDHGDIQTFKVQKHYHEDHGKKEKKVKINTRTKSENKSTVSCVCEVCGKACKNRGALKEHQTSHLPAEQLPFKCDQCHKSFSKLANLQIHVMRHNGIKNFECSYCGLKKATAREVRLHISNVHTKDRKVTCDKCSKEFLNPGCLRRHVKAVHFGQKKFKCSYCPEAFATGDTLKYHERRHTGEKPHQCLVCGHRFIQPVALKKHINTHKNLSDSLAAYATILNN